ncbi:MAG TPA: Asp-tRNA(Asn)/Glu-tRNA(Gln) amidotransferase subunit GatA [Candidatus Paceibacterota bacterium]
MEHTISSLSKKIHAGELSIKDVVSQYVSRAQADTLNVYREVFSDIESQVAAAEAMLKGGTATVLTGIPIAIKDNILFAGHKAGASSKILEHYTASYDSTVVKKLKAAGAIIIGRTNMDEFAMGSSTENSAYGVTKNPHDETKVPGGSSGGSASAVAADMAVASLGSDTGGSIRQPASYTGTVGLLPTYGTVSRHGLMAMGSSLDVIGPMAKTVEDAELLFSIISGFDALDSTSIQPEATARTLTKKLAIPKGVRGSKGLDAEVSENFEAMISSLEREGFTVDEVELPHFEHALAVYYILMPAEVSSNLARFDGIRYGERVGEGNVHDIYGATRGVLFGPEVRRRILLGTYVLSHGYYDAYYNKAVALRGIIRRELEGALKEYDAIITPTTPTPAFGIGEKAEDPVEMYLSDLFTVPANVAHHPALSVPSGKNAAGLPLGIQFIGARFDEATLFALGKIVENIR